MRPYLLAARDVIGFWLVWPVHAWEATPAVYRIALAARLRQEGR